MRRGQRVRQGEQTTRKIWNQFECDLKRSSETGLCTRRLYAVIRAIAHLAQGDTQEVEGTNSLVKIMGERCPNISLELLSSRICMRKALCQGARGAASSWNDVRPLATSIVDACVDHCHGARAFRSGGERWTLAPADTAVPKYDSFEQAQGHCDVAPMP